MKCPSHLLMTDLDVRVISEERDADLRRRYKWRIRANQVGIHRGHPDTQGPYPSREYSRGPGAVL
jgi:hypothetical protein